VTDSVTHTLTIFQRNHHLCQGVCLAWVRVFVFRYYRLQCARAIPVTWLGSGSCQPGLQGWVQM